MEIIPPYLHACAYGRTAAELSSRPEAGNATVPQNRLHVSDVDPRAKGGLACANLVIAGNVLCTRNASQPIAAARAEQLTYFRSRLLNVVQKINNNNIN